MSISSGLKPLFTMPVTMPFSALLVALFANSACKQADEQAVHPPGIQTSVALHKAPDCDTLQKSVQDAAVQQMRVQLDAEKTQGGLGPIAVSNGGAGAAASGAAPASYSTTNLQVAGVDEADFMKNDGTRIFTLAGETLYAAQSWPPQDLSLRGQLTIEGWPSEMFLDGNQVVVFSSLWDVSSGGGGGATPAAGVDLPVCDLAGDGCFTGSSTTKVTVVDVTDLTSPKVTSQLYLPGYSTGERRIGSSIRMVLSDDVRWPAGVQWWPSYNQDIYANHDLWVQAIDALEDANEALIRAAPLQSWFPDGHRTLDDGTLVDLTYQCTDFYLSNASEQLGLVTVATIDLDQLDAGIARTSIVGQADLLYATADHLYVASRHWWWWNQAGDQDWTYLHEFDISDPTQTAYIASGGVPGTIGDSFSMDEQDGYLRVATSTETYSQAAGAVDGLLVGSKLTVLAPQKVTATDGSTGTQLAVIGEIASLEDNERITAMRFVGNTGYAETFRAIDPFVTIDLTDPAHPKKIAELTLPGFSTYLQPIDATHLLALGEDVPVDANGVPDYSKSSMQLSLFDVSDLSNPQRTAVQLVGTAWSWSEASWDHHAFNWYQPDPTKPGILAIPFSDWSESIDNPWDGFVSDVRLFSADPVGTITPLGALGMSDVYIQESYDNWSWYYRPWIRRSVLSTDANGNTFVYAVADAGLRVAPLGQLGAPLATVLYPSAQ